MDEHSWLYLHGFDANFLTCERLRLEYDVKLAARTRSVRTPLHQPFDVVDIVDVAVQIDVTAPGAEDERGRPRLAAICAASSSV